MLESSNVEADIPGSQKQKPEKIKKQSQFFETMKRLRKNKAATLGLLITLVFFLVAIFAPIIAPYGYREMNAAHSNSTPSREHIFGCDDLGRDIFSRVLYGSRWSIGLGLAATAFGLLFGIILGCIAGYYGGFVENLIMRISDILQSIPAILLQIIISAALGSGFFFTVIALGFTRITLSCRLLRAQFLVIREQEFVEAAKALNVSSLRLVLKHILPNAIMPLIVTSTMGIGRTIMSAAALSYLGLGIQPPTPEWGAMLSDARRYIRYYPHMALVPGLCIAIFVLAMNLLGDGLRDALDPKLKS